ncbi:MAG: alpha/beta fold hydrolase [Pseudomonadota bacterium]|nr:alpha/beta fold hydrolase [Pseudomonadota bacterium]
MIVERFTFPNAEGHDLAAVLDLPGRKPRAYALFAHCFTCGKDVLAARRIAAKLTEHGLGVVRFDFTGLGASEGEFANSDFSSNVADLRAAVAAMRERGMAPALLIGHSLGGAAVLAAAESAPEAVAVVTIAAPSEPAHLAHLFADQLEAIRSTGEGELNLGGRTFRITRDFLEDIAAHTLRERIGRLKKALFVFHSPEDEVVGVENAAAIFGAAKHPKSFVSLHGADHLLSRPADAAYVADVIAAGVDRYLAPDAEQILAPLDEHTVAVAETGFGTFQQVAATELHRFHVDEPRSVGGLETGPTPYDLVLAGLGACTSMTVRLYAERKGWPLERTEVQLRHDRNHAQDAADCEQSDTRMETITRTLSFHGPLDNIQRAKLTEIAEKCPVHRTLSQGARIRTQLAD